MVSFHFLPSFLDNLSPFPTTRQMLHDMQRFRLSSHRIRRKDAFDAGDDRLHRMHSLRLRLPDHRLHQDGPQDLPSRNKKRSSRSQEISQIPTNQSLLMTLTDAIQISRSDQIIMYFMCALIIHVCILYFISRNPEVTKIKFLHHVTERQFLYKIVKMQFKSTDFKRQKIFEGNRSVSAYFLHYYQDNNDARMLLVDKWFLKTLGAYIFTIF